MQHTTIVTELYEAEMLTQQKTAIVASVAQVKSGLKVAPEDSLCETSKGIFLLKANYL